MKKRTGVCADPEREADRRRRISEGVRRNKQRSANISAALLGHPVSEETRRKIGDSQRGVPESPEANARRSTALKGREKTEEHRAAISASLLGHDVTEETRKRISAANDGRQQPEEERARRGAIRRRFLSDPANMEKFRRETREGIRDGAPNRFESDLAVLLAPLGFRFTGDRSFWLTGNGRHMNPDFIHEERKLIVEACGDYWHTEEETGQRTADFAAVGWTMFPVWESQFRSRPAEVFVRVLNWMVT